MKTLLPASILLDELRLLTQHHGPTWKVEHVLTALARSGKLPEVGPLEDFEPPDTRRARLAILRVLCANTVLGQAATIARNSRANASHDVPPYSQPQNDNRGSITPCNGITATAPAICVLMRSATVI